MKDTTASVASGSLQDGSESQHPPADGHQAGAPSRGTIIFVHGAGHGAWCWNEHFSSWFAERGFTVIAHDLPGHGDHDRSGLMRIPLNTYVAALAEWAAGATRPIILIGHSMGGFVVQKYLETNQADVAILLASLPPTGARGMVRRMVTRRPLAFLHTMLTSEATKNSAVTRDYFFSRETSREVIDSVHRRLQPESRQVLQDMMRALKPERVKSPVVVIGAENDWLVAPGPDLSATARAFGTLPRTLPGGHDMMLDFAWQQVAAEVDAAILTHATQLPPERAMPRAVPLVHGAVSVS